MSSLRGRIVRGLLAGLFTLLILQSVLVAYAIRHVTENYAAARLQHEIETLVAGLQWNGRSATLDTSRINEFYQRAFSGHYYRVDTPERIFRSRSLWDWELDLAPALPGERLRRHAVGPRSQPLLVLTHGFRKQGTAFSVTVAEDLSQVNADILRYQIAYAVLSIAFILVLAAATTWIVRRGLLPLQRTREELADLAQGRVALLDEQVPPEVRPLVQEINRLLQLTAQRLERSRKATGNLAHGLKTPLTILSRLSGDPALASTPDAQRTLSAQVERMRALVERELKRARLAGGGTASRRFHAAQDLPPLAHTLERIHEQRGVRIDLQIDPDHQAYGDREDMLELFGNLLDNACKWARSRVEVRIGPEPGLVATVADDGPGIDPTQADELLQRGARLDQAGEGHGLGLAIVSDIVHQYGGTIALSRAPSLGGLEVKLRLPPAG